MRLTKVTEPQEGLVDLKKKGDRLTPANIYIDLPSSLLIIIGISSSFLCFRKATRWKIFSLWTQIFAIFKKTRERGLNYYENF